MSVANTDTQHSAVRGSKGVLAQHAGHRPSGPEGAGRAEHQAEDASAARRAQLGEAKLWGFPRWITYTHTHAHRWENTRREKQSESTDLQVKYTEQFSEKQSHCQQAMFFPGPHQHNGLNQTLAEIQKVQNKIQQLDFILKTMATVGLAAHPPATYNFLNSSWHNQQFFLTHFHSENGIAWFSLLFFFFFWCV